MNAQDDLGDEKRYPFSLWQFNFKFFFFTSKGNNSDMEIFASLLTGAIIKGKNLLPLGANSFL